MCYWEIREGANHLEKYFLKHCLTIDNLRVAYDFEGQELVRPVRHYQRSHLVSLTLVEWTGFSYFLISLNGNDLLKMFLLAVEHLDKGASFLRENLPIPVLDHIQLHLVGSQVRHLFPTLQYECDR